MSRETTTRIEGEPAVDNEAVAFVLTVSVGPDSGQQIRVERENSGTVLLGHSTACTLRLSDPLVSRRHCSLQHAGPFLRIRDLDSTNGTFVDRVGVVEAELRGGELVRVGETVLRVDCETVANAKVPTTADRFGRMRGVSTEIRALYPLCARVAASAVSLVIEGETGTGKELLAECIHEAGPRAAGPFIVFDCTSVPANLVESELFGHESGVMAGAPAPRAGVFEQAEGGTLFIDEIADLDLALQSKLLRAFERLEVKRVGADRAIKVDVRVIAATRRNLDLEVQDGRFRDDLFHRLAVARIELPPLRHRRGDIALLANFFWNQLGGAPSGPPPELLGRWERYAWPGNVRELRNSVARALALGELAIAPSPRPKTTNTAPERERLTDWVTSGLPYLRARDELVEEFTRRFVEHVLDEHAGDSAKAADASGIGRRYFQKLAAKAKAKP